MRKEAQRLLILGLLGVFIIVFLLTKGFTGLAIKEGGKFFFSIERTTSLEQTLEKEGVKIGYDKETKIPNRIYSKLGISVTNVNINKENLEEATREFLQSNKAILKVDNEKIILDKAYYSPPARLSNEDLGVVNFYQEYKGIRVMGSYTKLAFKDSKLRSYESNFNPNINLDVNPSITKEEAERIVKEYEVENDNNIFSSSRGALKIYPKVEKELTTYHLVWEILPDYEVEHISLMYLVDAHTGEILLIKNLINYARYSGSIEGEYLWYDEDLNRVPKKEPFPRIGIFYDDGNDYGSCILSESLEFDERSFCDSYFLRSCRDNYCFDSDNDDNKTLDICSIDGLPCTEILGCNLDIDCNRSFAAADREGNFEFDSTEIEITPIFTFSTWNKDLFDNTWPIVTVIGLSDNGLLVSDLEGEKMYPDTPYNFDYSDPLLGDQSYKKEASSTLFYATQFYNYYVHDIENPSIFMMPDIQIKINHDFEDDDTAGTADAENREILISKRIGRSEPFSLDELTVSHEMGHMLHASLMGLENWNFYDDDPEFRGLREGVAEFLSLNLFWEIEGLNIIPLSYGPSRYDSPEFWLSEDHLRGDVLLIALARYRYSMLNLGFTGKEVSETVMRVLMRGIGGPVDYPTFLYYLVDEDRDHINEICLAFWVEHGIPYWECIQLFPDETKSSRYHGINYPLEQEDTFIDTTDADYFGRARNVEGAAGESDKNVINWKIERKDLSGTWTDVPGVNGVGEVEEGILGQIDTDAEVPGCFYDAKLTVNYDDGSLLSHKVSYQSLDKFHDQMPRMVCVYRTAGRGNENDACELLAIVSDPKPVYYDLPPGDWRRGIYSILPGGSRQFGGETNGPLGDNVLHMCDPNDNGDCLRDCWNIVGVTNPNGNDGINAFCGWPGFDDCRSVSFSGCAGDDWSCIRGAYAGLEESYHKIMYFHYFVKNHVTGRFQSTQCAEDSEGLSKDYYYLSGLGINHQTPDWEVLWPDNKCSGSRCFPNNRDTLDGFYKLTYENGNLFHSYYMSKGAVKVNRELAPFPQRCDVCGCPSNTPFCSPDGLSCTDVNLYCGDVDLDFETFTTNDLNELYWITLKNLNTNSLEYWDNYDFDKNNKVDVGDYLLMKKYLVNGNSQQCQKIPLSINKAIVDYQVSPVVWRRDPNSIGQPIPTSAPYVDITFNLENNAPVVGLETILRYDSSKYYYEPYYSSVQGRASSMNIYNTNPISPIYISASEKAMKFHLYNYDSNTNFQSISEGNDNVLVLSFKITDLVSDWPNLNYIRPSLIGDSAYNDNLEEMRFSDYCGDANNDGRITSADIIFLVNHIFKGGQAPEILEAADANGDTKISAADIIYLVNSIFKGGPAPICSNQVSGTQTTYTQDELQNIESELAASGIIIDITPADTIPPIRSNGKPSGTLSSGTTQTTISLTTDEISTCKYSTTSNVLYDSMTNTFTTTNSTNHTQIITGLTNGKTYNYYIKCKDTYNNPNKDDYLISFSSSSTTTKTVPKVSGVE